MSEGDVVMTRSEEQLRITAHRRETQRARLTKYVETETETRTIAVRREQVRIEYEPFSDESRSQPATGSESSAERWMVLYDEEVVVQTRWVARERVRLTTHSVTEEREISDQLRQEQIEFDDRDKAQ